MKLYIITNTRFTQNNMNATKPFEPIFADMRGRLTAEEPGQSCQSFLRASMCNRFRPLARRGQCLMTIQALCARETIVGVRAGVFLGRWGRGGHDLAVIRGVELFHEAGIAPA